jgi:hypothetical protein
MSSRLRLRTAFAGLLFCCAGTAAAQNGLALSVALPESETWAQISDRSAGQSYSKEWIPDGDDADEPSWLVSQQKVPVDRNVDAEGFLRTIYDMTEDACKSATHDEIERLRVGDARAAVGRTQCGQRLDGYYGTFTDRLVIVDGGFAYVITSELRTPPMLVDGILSFGRGDDSDSTSARREFVEREALSRKLVRDGVTVE